MLKNPKITVDTNILISSFICVSAVAVKVIDLAEEGLYEIAVSEDIIKEFKKVAKVKFEWNDEKNTAAESILRRLCTVVNPSVRVKAVKQDPDDDRIIECALESKSGYIVTGDKHLLNLKEYKSIKILTPAQFINLML